jgi:bacteriocin biosynthesis cyclodehydratase domain-containing protein
MRPTLRPGLRILRRDRTTMQLGLDWPGLVVMHETPALRAVLASMDGFRLSDGVIMAAEARGHAKADCEAALANLMECGAVVDADELRDPDVPEPSWAAWSLLAGPHGTATSICRSRRRHQVAVIGEGLVADRVRALVPLSHVAQTADAAAADLLVIASDDEGSRKLADTTMHNGVTHLWVCLRDLIGVVGPFVVPGETACLRCVDAARSELDPSWPTLVESAAVRALRVPAGDAVMANLVAAWAVHEVALWASDIRPQTYGHVLEIPYGSGVIEAVRVERHPQCGCGWLVERDTMGA